MITKIEMYTVKCDNCGKLFEDEHQGYCAWNDSNGALENAQDSGWLKENIDTHYCPDCVSYDDDDNLVLKLIENKAG